MIKEYTGRGAGRSRRERYQRTRWTEEIQITFFDCENTEEIEKSERDGPRPGSDVKVEIPPSVNAKSIFLEAARLRNKDSQQFGPVGARERDAKIVVASTADNAKFVDLLARLSLLLENRNLTEAQAILETLKRRMPPVPSAVGTVLETFDGVLDCIDGDTAYVTLTSATNGDVLYGEYPAASFSAKGIEEEDRFICKTVEMDGATRIEIEAVPDAELTEENIRAIREKIEKVLPRNDPGIEY